jgi:2-polyprenyl-3-methyl-5-hydroxy-6-metoxy-1,4-benzoquinol methylase
MEINIIDKVITNYPYPALCITPQLIKRERVYGIVKRIRFFLDHIEKERSKKALEIREMKILDVGCGTGAYVTIPLAHAGYTVYGLDMNTPSIECARQLASEAGISSVVFYDSFELVEQEGPFHAIICSEVMEHLQDPLALLNRLHGLLGDGGILLVTVPNGYGYFELDSIFWRRFPQLSVYAFRAEKHLSKLEDGLKKIFGASNHAMQQGVQTREASVPSTLSPDEAHTVFFSYKRVLNLLHDGRFAKIEFKNNTFLAGNLIETLFKNSTWFLKWNCWVANFLPYWLCSDWMFAFRKSELK